MAVFEITDNTTGAVFEITGPEDRKPTQEEIRNLIASQQTTPQEDVTAQPTAQAPARPPDIAPARFAQQGTLFDRIVEPLVTLGTGAVAEPLAGLAGIVQPINPFTTAQTPTQAVEQTRESITFPPTTVEGKIGLQSIVEFPPVDLFVRGMQATEKFLGDLGFDLLGPIGGAIGSAVPTAILEGLGLASLRNLRLGKANLVDNAGTPTPELKLALDEAGVKFEDLTPEAVKELSGARIGLTPEEVVRRQRFEEQEIPFTAGDVTQKFKQVSEEQRLLQMAEGAETEPLRQLKLQQSEAFIRNVEKTVDDLGGTEEAGDVLKSALEGRVKLLTKEKNALYEEFARTAPEVLEIPVITDTILDSIPDVQTVRRINRLTGRNGQALQDLLVEFGIDKDPIKVDRFLKSGETITPLNIGNFDDFRQGINLVESADNTGGIKVISGPIKKALDNEAGLLEQAVKNAGITDESILAPLRKARAIVRTIKTEFSPQSAVGRLIGARRDGVTPIIEASKVADEILKPNAPIENLQRTIDSLNKSGEKGKSSIKALQASVFLKALDDALQAPTVKTGGVQTIVPNQFVKSIEKFGDDKLSVLFADNPKMLQQLKSIKEVARDITPANVTVPKGSAAVIMDTLRQAKDLPFITGITKTINFIINSEARVVRRAMKADPSVRKGAELIRSDFPALATALGIAEFRKDPRLRLNLSLQNDQ